MNHPYHLSKSKYLAGLQCPRLLWWTIHEPDAEELVPDAALRALFDQGHQVGALARERVPAGVLIEVPHYQHEERIRATRDAMAAGHDVVYEAAIEHEDVIVVADILKRDGRGWTLIEVKQSTKVKPEHLPDLAVQTWVLRGAGLDVDRMELMHLNRQCRYPDLSDLFLRKDCTELVEATLHEVPHRIEEMKRSLAGGLPDAGPGGHCTDPYPCPFRGRCWAHVPQHSLWTLYKLRAGRREALERAGVRTVGDLADGIGLTAIQNRQRRAVQQGRLIVEGDIGRVVGALEFPIAYLDFETIWPAIPVWDGMRPYDHAPVQLSVHVEERDGSIRHHEWLADGSGDPRQEVSRRVVGFCEGAGSVVAYNASFEQRCLRGLRNVSPGLERELARVEGRLWDLLSAVRNHVYHPAFHGSFSLKKVLPSLVPDRTGYEGTAIPSGDVASAVLQDLLLDPDRFTPEERRQMRYDLLQYCKLDTLAMVRLVAWMRQVATS
jgi:predicted RecB family nuclease